MIEIRPIPKSPQDLLLKSKVREIGFGGQAGGGKSYGLILDALYQLNKPSYNAIMFRRTYKQLSGADGLIELSRQVYPLLGGHFMKTEYLWTFSNYPGTVRFAHLEHESDVYKYSGHQYAWIGFDQLDEFLERQYLFLFSRNRCSNPDVDIYMRSAFNPGGIGHFWIKKRFIDADITNSPEYFKRVDGQDVKVSVDDPLAMSRMFIPSRLEDNPYLWLDGQGEYEKSLHQLDNVDFRRLRLGDWDIRRTGRVYHGFLEPGPPSYELNLSQAEGWYHAHDFGAVNRAWGLLVKIGPNYYLMHEAILPEGTTAARANQIKAHFKERKMVAGFGGAKGEDQQRKDYTQEGVPIRLPRVTDVEARSTWQTR
jgi:hypothetical protein